MFNNHPSTAWSNRIVNQDPSRYRLNSTAANTTTRHAGLRCVVCDSSPFQRLWQACNWFAGPSCYSCSRTTSLAFHLQQCQACNVSTVLIVLVLVLTEQSMLYRLQRFNFSAVKSSKVRSLVHFQLVVQLRINVCKARKKSKFAIQTMNRLVVNHVGRGLQSTDRFGRSWQYSQLVTLKYKAQLVNTVFEEEVAPQFHWYAASWQKFEHRLQRSRCFIDFENLKKSSRYTSANSHLTIDSVMSIVFGTC